jgi:hypothetical protein
MRAHQITRQRMNVIFEIIKETFWYIFSWIKAIADTPINGILELKLRVLFINFVRLQTQQTRDHFWIVFHPVMTSFNMTVFSWVSLDPKIG